MIIRNSIAAGQFYPRTSGDIKSMLDRFSRRAEVSERDLLGAVAPHAGYMYCGETQAHVYESLMEDLSTFVIVGPNHSGRGAPEALMTSGTWQTPLGNSRIDSELAGAILENSEFLEDDYNAHNQEHSIEVQLPWLQHKYGSINFVPISMSDQSLEKARDIGRAIKEAGEEVAEKFVVIASSDFTHFGASYGYTPVSGGPGKILNYIEDVDREAAGSVENLAPESFMDVVERYGLTICGRGAVAAMLYAVDDRAQEGELLHYSTSHEVSKDPNAVVGYCAIVIE